MPARAPTVLHFSDLVVINGRFVNCQLKQDLALPAKPNLPLIKLPTDARGSITEVVKEMQTNSIPLRNALMNVQENLPSSMLVVTDLRVSGRGGLTTAQRDAFLSMTMEPAVQHPSHALPKLLQIPMSAIIVARTTPLEMRYQLQRIVKQLAPVLPALHLELEQRFVVPVLSALICSGLHSPIADSYIVQENVARTKRIAKTQIVPLNWILSWLHANGAIRPTKRETECTLKESTTAKSVCARGPSVVLLALAAT